MANNEQLQDFAELLDEDREDLLDEVRRLIDERIGEALSFERLTQPVHRVAPTPTLWVGVHTFYELQGGREDLFDHHRVFTEQGDPVLGRVPFVPRVRLEHDPPVTRPRDTLTKEAPQDSPGPELPVAVRQACELLRSQTHTTWPAYARALESTVRNLIEQKEEAERERDEAIQERGEALRRAGKAERAFDRLTFTNSDNVDRIRKLEAENARLREALATCVRVFQSQADRGRYPEELLPDSEHYIGVQGFHFATSLLPTTGATP